MNWIFNPKFKEMLVRVLQQFLLENFGHILTVNQRKVDERRIQKKRLYFKEVDIGAWYNGDIGTFI